ncbi:MAG: helix-turn-helix domain-containing protein [Pseudonocardiaceae bacterium]
MSLVFRNIDVSPEDPVEVWPTEAIVTALERGGLSHWRRLAAAIGDDPWGPVARQVEEALEVSRPYGVAVVMEDLLATARKRAGRAERAEVAAEITRLLAASGMTRAEFAAAIGTSASRLSTYLSGQVTPSAALLVRMRRVAHRSGRSVRESLMTPRPGPPAHSYPRPAPTGPAAPEGSSAPRPGTHRSRLPR